MKTIWFCLSLVAVHGAYAVDPEGHLYAEAKNGDGVILLLNRYHLGNHPCNLEEFYRLNRMEEKDHLLAGKSYRLPILKYSYNGKSIRSSLGITDYEKALRIQKYNSKLLSEKKLDNDFRSSRELWVPYHELFCENRNSSTTEVKSASPSINAKKLHLPVLGKNHQEVNVISEKLKNKVFYLIAGHGGPDPGAVGKSGKAQLCEDEYAYDVTLRVYQGLLEQGAKAYLIIQDKNDGIRDQSILPCDQDEECNGNELPLNQAKRLKQRVQYVNQLYEKNRKKGFTQQIALDIHVDSRSKNHRQDVFFCYAPESESSKKLAETLKNTFARKYKQFRAGGHYAGCIDPRDNLYVLRNLQPKSVLIELANIQNQADHKRILDSDNRQAVANWLIEGLSVYCAKK